MNPQGGQQATQGISDTPPWCSDQGTVLTFKIKRFPPPGVGNGWDSDTKSANKGGDFDRRNCQMLESPGSANEGITLTGALPVGGGTHSLNHPV